MLRACRAERPTHPRRNTPFLVCLLLIRRQAEVGLLREGGMTVAQVCRYVRDLRREVEQERALRRRGIDKCRRRLLGTAPSAKQLTAK
jgi:hypothetical protein